jgi:hypothetical protein
LPVLERSRAVIRPALFALAVVATSAPQAPPASAGGTWTVSANISGNASEQSCTFTQKDADLTGTCKGERGSVTIAGKVEGKTVNWQYDTQYEGQTLTIYYSGTLEADKIAGSVNVQPMNVGGEFTATKAK